MTRMIGVQTLCLLTLFTSISAMAMSKEMSKDDLALALETFGPEECERNDLFNELLHNELSFFSQDFCAGGERRVSVLQPTDKWLASLVPEFSSVDILKADTRLRRDLVLSHVFDGDLRTQRELRSRLGSKVHVLRLEDNEDEFLVEHNRVYRCNSTLSCVDVYVIDAVLAFDNSTEMEKSTDINFPHLELPILPTDVELLLRKELKSRLFARMWRRLLTHPRTKVVFPNQVLVVAPSDSSLEHLVSSLASFETERIRVAESIRVAEKLSVATFLLESHMVFNPGNLALVDSLPADASVAVQSLSGRRVRITKMLNESFLRANNMVLGGIHEVDLFELTSLEALPLFNDDDELRSTIDSVIVDDDEEVIDDDEAPHHLRSIDHLHSAFVPALPFRISFLLRANGAAHFAHLWNAIRMRQQSKTASASGDGCDQPVLEGECDSRLARYYFNSHTKMCEPFIFSGCGGNENNFETFDKCQMACVKLEREVSKKEKGAALCQLGAYVDEGDSIHCRALLPAWTYKDNSCIPFFYNGCGASENNFGLQEKCVEMCPSNKKLVILAPSDALLAQIVESVGIETLLQGEQLSLARKIVLASLTENLEECQENNKGFIRSFNPDSPLQCSQLLKDEVTSLFSDADFELRLSSRIRGVQSDDLRAQSLTYSVKKRLMSSKSTRYVVPRPEERVIEAIDNRAFVRLWQELYSEEITNIHPACLITNYDDYYDGNNRSDEHIYYYDDHVGSCRMDDGSGRGGFHFDSFERCRQTCGQIGAKVAVVMLTNDVGIINLVQVDDRHIRVSGNILLRNIQQEVELGFYTLKEESQVEQAVCNQVDHNIQSVKLRTRRMGEEQKDEDSLSMVMIEETDLPIHLTLDEQSLQSQSILRQMAILSHEGKVVGCGQVELESSSKEIVLKLSNEDLRAEVTLRQSTPLGPLILEGDITHLRHTGLNTLRMFVGDRNCTSKEVEDFGLIAALGDGLNDHLEQPRQHFSRIHHHLSLYSGQRNTIVGRSFAIGLNNNNDKMDDGDRACVVIDANEIVESELVIVVPVVEDEKKLVEERSQMLCFFALLKKNTLDIHHNDNGQRYLDTLCDSKLKLEVDDNNDIVRVEGQQVIEVLKINSQTVIFTDHPPSTFFSDN